MAEDKKLTPELSKLRIDLGDWETYDSVSQCNRCGYCEQVCPTYVVTGKESMSGRGRNQIVRMMLEGKLSDPKAAEEALSTCLLCGACTSICYAHVATVDHVLEGRRQIRAKEGIHPIAKLLMDWLADQPRKFRLLLKFANFGKTIGVSKLVAQTGLLRLLGLPVLETAETHVSGAPLTFLEEILAKDPELAWPRTDNKPGWFYFAPCGPNFLLTEVGQATVRALKKLHGPGAFLKNGCCGLLHYNYGELAKARELAQRLIVLAEKAPDGPIVGDCSSCVAHLKTYAQLFLDEPLWMPRAEAFVKRVRDAAEMYPADLVTPSLSREGAGGRVDDVATYHDSCRARNGQYIIKQPRETMKACEGQKFCELPEAEWCCGGAGAFAFTHPEMSNDIVKRKVSNIASTQAKVVGTSSTSCVIQLAYGLKKYYPECRVAHISQIVDEKLTPPAA